MENPDSQSVKRRSERQAARATRPGVHSTCRCCADCQVPSVKRKRQPSANAANPSKKRKGASSKQHEHPEVLNPTPPPQPSTSEQEEPRPMSPIPPDDLPVASNVPASPKPSPAPQRPDSPLRIHNHSVEEYQRIYHEVVDEMLTFKNGQPRPYSLDLGRRIKQKLWERLNRPTLTTFTDEDGRLHVVETFGAGIYPPQHNVDVSLEPKPQSTREKSSN